jgi:hypothetical protein
MSIMEGELDVRYFHQPRVDFYGVTFKTQSWTSKTHQTIKLHLKECHTSTDSTRQMLIFILAKLPDVRYLTFEGKS